LHITRFFMEFLSSPGSMGAVIPSSKHLARKILEWVNLAEARTVVEYGPGTGAFTDLIVRTLPSDTKFFAIELNEKLADVCRDRHPQVPVYVESVSNVEDVCRREGVSQVDCVISGLPWSCFSENLQTDILEATARVLRAGGEFITFAYPQGLLLPAGQRFRKKLQEYFTEVSRSPIEWRNFPPAFVYYCRR
jgi:phospholipid N-methyltransferase